ALAARASSVAGHRGLPSLFPRTAGAAVKPRLLDLFCGAGGAAMGYSRAGFEVVRVDIKPQPRYPFEFIQADAMTFPLEGFNVIHASPPCQRWVTLTQAPWMPSASRMNTRPDLLHP